MADTLSWNFRGGTLSAPRPQPNQAHQNVSPERVNVWSLPHQHFLNHSLFLIFFHKCVLLFCICKAAKLKYYSISDRNWPDHEHLEVTIQNNANNFLPSNQNDILTNKNFWCNKWTFIPWAKVILINQNHCGVIQVSYSFFWASSTFLEI